MKNKQSKPHRSSKIKVTFKGGRLSNFSGILPVQNFMRKLKVGEIFQEMVTIPEHHNTQFSLPQILTSIILGLISGQDRIIKIESFTHDPLVQKLMHLKKNLDKDTILGKIKKFTFQQTNQLMELNSKLSGKVHQKLAVSEDILDIDSSVRTVYGKQEGAEKGFNHQPGRRSYHPLLAFLDSARECVLSWLRPGNAYTANNAAAFLKQAFALLPGGIKHLLVRADSGFFDDKLISEIESHAGATYLIKVKLRNLKSVLSAQEWLDIPGMPGWSMTDFDYQAHGWKSPRHFSALRKLKTQMSEGVLFPLIEYDYFCYVSNLEETPLYLHRLYGNRGTSENWIEAVKNQMFAGSLLTKRFWANEAFWLLSVMAYNISLWMRILTDKNSWREEPCTFRMWFIQLAGRLVSSGRRYTLKLYQAYHYKERWLHLHHQVELLEFR